MKRPFGNTEPMRLLCVVVLATFLLACGSETTPEPAVAPVLPAAQPATVEAMPQILTATPISDALMPVPPGVIPLPITSAPTPEATIADSASGIAAQVSNVVDGDTIDVVFADGSTDRVRLLGIDTPETFSANRPGEYGDITDTACLDRWGDMATVFASIMRGQLVTLTLDPQAGERGSFGRLLAYVEFAGEDFNAALVELGFARVYTEGTASRESDYLQLETAAREQRKGLWGDCQVEPAEPAPAQSETPTAGAAPTLCDPSYPGVCIPPPPPDLDCGEVSHRRFTVLPPDPHGFDGDGDGIGCESGSALPSPVAPAPPPPPVAPAANCDLSYPTVCIPPRPPDLDCGEIPHRNFTVLPPDPHRFDGDKDGVGCET